MKMKTTHFNDCTRPELTRLYLCLLEPEDLLLSFQNCSLETGGGVEFSIRVGGYLMTQFCHTRLHLGFSAGAGLKIFQVPTWKMEPQRGCIMQRTPSTNPSTHPPNRLTWDMEILFFQCFVVSPPQLFPSSRRYVRGPTFQCTFFCAVSRPQCNHMPLSHSALSWVLSKVENLANSSLQYEATD